MERPAPTRRRRTHPQASRPCIGLILSPGSCLTEWLIGRPGNADKPSRREVEVTPDFVDFTVEDVFVVGYGIDHAEAHRHLPWIGSID